MIIKPFRLQCRNCLYKLGIIKFIICPCLECKAFGGKAPPPTIDTLLIDKLSRKKNSK